MKELEVLLNKRWILKSRDKETYYKLMDALGELRKFTTEKLGCQIVDNSLLIKMEKIPVIPESFMGIQKFSSKEEYAYFCFLLMFLEDRDTKSQFILSNLTEYITANMPGNLSDWTLYTNRRRLIRVLRFAVDQGIIEITDGKDDAFMDDEAGEVLYENTGASRYFMKSFSKDIMEYSKAKDFEESDWLEVDEDRGFVRRHRVYKRLIFAPGMYKEDAMLYQVQAVKKDGSLHKGMEGFEKEGHIVQVPLGVIMEWKSLLCPQNEIYIVENPSVFAVLCGKEEKNKAYMCMNGQPRLAGLVVLDLLEKSGTRIFYAGDLDPEGVLIAQKLRQYYKGEFCYWQMEVEDYERCRSEEIISPKRMKILERITDESLKPVARMLEKYGRAGYQEKLMLETKS